MRSVRPRPLGSPAATHFRVRADRVSKAGNVTLRYPSQLRQAATQLSSIAARSYEARDLDVDAQNAKTLAALREVPWDE